MGSLAHDQVYAVAAVGWRGRLVGLGVDIEPAEPLPEDLLDLVLRPPEQSETEGDGVASRLVFAAKEAVFKAVYPLDRTAFEYPDVEVRLGEKTATLRASGLPTSTGLIIAVRSSAIPSPGCAGSSGDRL